MKEMKKNDKILMENTHYVNCQGMLGGSFSRAIDCLIVGTSTWTILHHVMPP